MYYKVTGVQTCALPISQAQVALALDRPEETLQATRAAAAEFGARTDMDSIKGLHFYQGQALARLGRGEEAARAVRRAVGRGAWRVNGGIEVEHSGVDIV